MNIEIRFVHAVQNDSLESQVREKLENLERKYEWITNAAVFLKTEKHPNEENYVCEIRLSVPGPQLFASSNEVNFNKAINSTIQQLGIQLEKQKAKLISH
ncbi:MAG: ribosome-associated translation inhibitor RaiA [Crocinitomicaceae bacterium]|nr:ribosome-associated translation inhibitor RaiA [Crocinitomicaceae bacterium]